jgi:hypothetical protein
MRDEALKSLRLDRRRLTEEPVARCRSRESCDRAGRAGVHPLAFMGARLWGSIQVARFSEDLGFTGSAEREFDFDGLLASIGRA